MPCKVLVVKFIQNRSNSHVVSIDLPCSKHFSTVGTRVAEVFNALVDYLDVAVKVAFLAEYLIALRTSGWLVDLDVQMHLGVNIYKLYHALSSSKTGHILVE